MKGRKLAEVVTPVAKTGLHCGVSRCARARPLAHVTPVAKTGLHCGVLAWLIRRGAATVTPVAKTGLHCGRTGAAGDDLGDQE